MRYVTYYKHGLLTGGYLPDNVNPQGMTDDALAKAVLYELNPPDVRKLDMEKIRAELHEALIQNQLDITRIGFGDGATQNILTAVLLRHIYRLVHAPSGAQQNRQAK